MFGLSEGTVIFLAGYAVTGLGIVVTFYNKTQIRLRALEMRVDMYEKHENKVESKLDDIYEELMNLKIELQRKQDK